MWMPDASVVSAGWRSSSAPAVTNDVDHVAPPLLDRARRMSEVPRPPSFHTTYSTPLCDPTVGNSIVRNALPGSIRSAPEADTGETPAIFTPAPNVTPPSRDVKTHSLKVALPEQSTSIRSANTRNAPLIALTRGWAPMY